MIATLRPVFRLNRRGVTGNVKLRHGLGLNQAEFWERLEITQSGGSRYESERPMPRPVRRLLGLVHLKEKL